MTSYPSPNPNLLSNGVTVRVYGILVNERKQVLVSDEYYYGQYITKFPGGGLEFGETTRACLIREWLEELSLDIEVGEHIYTSDVFQTYPRRCDLQMLCIYYVVKPVKPLVLHTKSKPFDFNNSIIENHRLSLRWLSIDAFDGDCMTLLTDKMVAETIKKRFVMYTESKHFP